jgi:hypothetical protein
MSKRTTVADLLSLAKLERRYRRAHDPVERSHVQIVWLLAQGKTRAGVAAVTGGIPTPAAGRSSARRSRTGSAPPYRDRRPTAGSGRAPKSPPGSRPKPAIRAIHSWAGPTWCGSAPGSYGRGHSTSRSIPPRWRPSQTVSAGGGSAACRPSARSGRGLGPRRAPHRAPTRAAAGLDAAGQRPRAVVWSRYQWCSVVAFVRPETGESVWLLVPRIATDVSGLALAEFARAVGVGPSKRLILVVDQAGWHRSHDLVVPDALHLEYLPAYARELQPAERLWTLLDEVLANRVLPDLDTLLDVLSARCQLLRTWCEGLARRTCFH